MARRIKCVRRDIQLSEEVFGSGNIWWANDWSWIKIDGFNLPPNLNKKKTNCLVIIPDGYGYGCGLEEFYLDPGLRVRKKGKWVEIPHVFDDPSSSFNKFSQEGWRWFCIHPVWEEDDNLLTFLKRVELFLNDPFSFN